MRPYKWYYALMFQAPVLCGFYFIFYNYGVKLVFDAVEKNTIFSYQAFLIPVTIFIASEVYVNLVWRLSNYAGLKVHPHVTASIRQYIYNKVLYYNYKFYQDTPSGSIISKAKGIVDSFYAVFGSLHHNISMQVIHTIFPALAIGFVSIKLAIIVLASTCMYCYIMFIMSSKLNKLSKEFTDTQHQSLAMFGDAVSNIATVLSFSSRLRELNKIQKYLNEEMIVKDKNAFRYYIKMQWVGMFFYVYMLGFAMMYTIYLRYNGGISMGDFAFVMGLVFTSVDHSWRFTSEVQNFIQQLGSLNSSIELLNRDETREYLTLPNIVKSNHGEIEITNLTFAYNQGVNIFQDFNLHIPAGQKVGIVGHSGSGKSTLVSIILKNLIPQKGEVKIDNLSIYDYNEDSVRDQIALIPQDTILFHRSIFENIAYPVPNASLEDVVRVANIVKLDEVIESMPQKYNTLVGERGIKLSGGQRQRVAIARAMLKKAPIMILDEATSSLDSLTESEIQKSLNQMLSLTNSTVIAIAHRLSTIRNLDRIVVMNQGKIIEDGTFNDLINKPNGKFRELWNNQVNGMLV